MGNNRFCSLIFAVIMTITGCLFLTTCELGGSKNNNNSATQGVLAMTECFVDTNCGNNQVCKDHKCAVRTLGTCSAVSGICTSVLDDCASGYGMWTQLDCTSGNACCLPLGSSPGSCSNVRGSCVPTTKPCPGNSETAGQLDCAAGSECCVSDI